MDGAREGHTRAVVTRTLTPAGAASASARVSPTASPTACASRRATTCHSHAQLSARAPASTRATAGGRRVDVNQTVSLANPNPNPNPRVSLANPNPNPNPRVSLAKPNPNPNPRASLANPTRDRNRYWTSPGSGAGTSNLACTAASPRQPEALRAPQDGPHMASGSPLSVLRSARGVPRPDL